MRKQQTAIKLVRSVCTVLWQSLPVRTGMWKVTSANTPFNLFFSIRIFFFSSVNCYLHTHRYTFAIQHMAEDDAVRHEKYLELWNCTPRHPTVPALYFTPFMLLLRTYHLLYSPCLHHPHTKNEIGNYRFQLSISTDFFCETIPQHFSTNLFIWKILVAVHVWRSWIFIGGMSKNIFRVLAVNCWTIPWSV